MATNQKFSVHPLEVTNLSASTMAGQDVAVELATFPLGPRQYVGHKASNWRPHPNTTQGRKVKVL